MDNYFLDDYYGRPLQQISLFLKIFHNRKYLINESIINVLVCYLISTLQMYIMILVNPNIFQNIFNFIKMADLNDTNLISDIKISNHHLLVQEDDFFCLTVQEKRFYERFMKYFTSF